VKEQESLDQINVRKLEYTVRSPFYKELHTPHLKTFLPKPWLTARGEFLIGEDWGVSAENLSEPPGQFAVEELKSFFMEAGNIELEDKSANKLIVLRVAGKADNRLDGDSYSLLASPRRIEIISATSRGVLYGVYYLEQILLDRGIPALRSFRIQRRPLFDIRMFGEVYGTFTISGLRIERPVNRNTFSMLSRFGANATFTFVRLGDYVQSNIYPELNNPDREKNLEELSRLAKMAKSVGVDLYINAYNPKLPSDHPLFKAHPNAMGASQHGKNIRSLCPSDPQTLKFIADQWADVFRRVPELGGMIAIVGGEGFYHCFMRSGKGAPDCPRCSSRQAEDVVADLTNAVFRAIRKVKPDAEMLVWPYSAFVWSKEPYQLELISRLDPGIQLVSEIDKDYLYVKEGYSKNIWDYSIDFVGPSDRFKAQLEHANSLGMAICCKTETATAWEYTGVPYIPCMQRWAERMRVIHHLKPRSILYAYDCTGFARSRPEELAGRLSWEPLGGYKEEIQKIAVRDFGEHAADAIINAWNYFSEAIGHCPYLTHGYYMGPSFIGAGQPLMLKDSNMPRDLYGRFFYLAEADASNECAEAVTLRPIYASDIRESPAGMKDMEQALLLWEKGVDIMRSAREHIDEAHLKEFKRELDLAEYLLCAFRCIVNCNEFFRLRAEYEDHVKSGRKDAASETLALMESIARAELRNARRALLIARRDPRLDLAVRLDMDYPPLVKIIEAKITRTEKTIHEEIPHARGLLN